MSIYNGFGIEFIKKDGIYTHFKLNNNNNTNLNMENIAKVFCLFTIGVFSTDSVERKLIYKKSGNFFCDSIDNLCELYFTNSNSKCENIDLPDNTNFVEYSDGIFSLNKFANTKITNCVYNARAKFISNNGDNNMPNDCITTPGTKLKIKKNIYTSRAEIEADHDDNDDDALSFYDFDINNSRIVDNVYDISDNANETMGNYGSYLIGSKNLKEIKYEERYSIFDFDNFNINVKNVSTNEYICNFTPINGVNHAASMFAQSCTVDYTDINADSLFVINNVSIKFVNNGSYYDVVTTYFGIDVL